MWFLTRRPTELLEPGPCVGELKAQSSSILQGNALWSREGERGREAAQHFVSVARLLAEEYNEQAFVWCGYALARVVGWCALSLLAGSRRGRAFAR